MKIQGHYAISSLALIHSAVAILVRRNSTSLTFDVGSLSGVSAWDSNISFATTAGGVAAATFAPHAGNEECSSYLGRYWTLPQSDVAVRHNLIPGATVIFEVGGNIGEDLEQYVWRFPHAKIFSFEPVPELFAILKQKFGSNPNVELIQAGVSNSDRYTSFTVGGKHGEGSTHANNSAYGQTITVQLRDVHSMLTWVQEWTGKVADVVSINCEGCEYDVLSRMAQMGWLGRVGFVQLSWHVVDGIPDRLKQRCTVEKTLWDHYEPAYHALYGWQGWKLKR